MTRHDKKIRKTSPFDEISFRKINSELIKEGSFSLRDLQTLLEESQLVENLEVLIKTIKNKVFLTSSDMSDWAITDLEEENPAKNR